MLLKTDLAFCSLSLICYDIRCQMAFPLMLWHSVYYRRVIATSVDVIYGEDIILRLVSCLFACLVGWLTGWLAGWQNN